MCQYLTLEFLRVHFLPPQMNILLVQSTKQANPATESMLRQLNSLFDLYVTSATAPNVTSATPVTKLCKSSFLTSIYCWYVHIIKQKNI